MELAAVDLFCGIGGLTYGVQKSGINVVAGIDIDESCRFAYETNNLAKFINKSIEELDYNEVAELFPEKSIKILMGCAPCQPFSTYSFRYKKDGHKDDKWRLLYYFKDLISKIRPEVVSMENVPQLLKEKVYSDFIHDLEKYGYYIDSKVVNCAHYGVPQNRNRLVLLASRMGEIHLKECEFDDKNAMTVGNAIKNLPPIKDGERYSKDLMHRASKLTEVNKLRIKQSLPGGTWKDWDDDLKLPCHKRDTGKGYRSVYGRMEWDKPAPTITTQFYGYGNGRFGHPEQDRALSLREGAILQSFPSDYKFIDEDNHQTNRKLGIHIGNAVPVELGRAIGESIVIHIKSLVKGD